MALNQIKILVFLWGLSCAQGLLLAGHASLEPEDRLIFSESFLETQRLAHLLWATHQSLSDGGMRGESREAVATFSLAFIWGIQVEVGIGLHRFRLSERPHFRLACGFVEGLGLFSTVSAQLTERHRHSLITPEELDGLEAQFGFGPALSTGHESVSPRQCSYRTKIGRSPGIGLGAGLVFSQGMIRAMGVPIPLAIPRSFALKILKAEAVLDRAARMLSSGERKKYLLAAEASRTTRANLWELIQKMELNDSPFFYRSLPSDHAFSNPEVFAAAQVQPARKGKCSRFLALLLEGC